MINITKIESPFPGIAVVDEFHLDAVAAAGVLSTVVHKDFTCDLFDDGSFTVTTLDLPMISLGFEGEASELVALNAFIKKVFDLRGQRFANREHAKRDIRRKLMETFGVPEADFELGLELRLKDLISSIQLYREGTCTFREAIDIAFI